MSARPRSTRPRRAALVVALATLALGNVDARAAGLDDAAYVSSENVPATLFCGQTATVKITMRNSGTSNWLRNAYRLRSQNPAGTTRWGTSSVQPTSNVGAGASTTFEFTITAPATAGTYDFQWQMHNGVLYFGALTPNVSIPVICDGSNGYKVGYREVTGSALATLWSGGSRIVEDTAFTAPSVFSHVETSTVFWGGRYLMYYRTPNGAAVSLATSTDGHTWVAHNNGTPVFSRPAGTSVKAPNVMVDRDGAGRPRLTMVVEHCCFPENNIARTYSYDGFNWQNPVDIVVPTDGTFDEHNAGTPNIVRTPDGQYRLGYHGQCCTSPFSNALSVGFANGSTLDAPLAKTGPVIGNNRAVAPGWWATAGAGARDIIKEGNYWYMVMEGLRGYINCGVEELSSWGIARTLDSTFRTGWQFSSHSPVRTDRQGRACGEDMPRFQVVNGVPYVVVTAMQQFGDNGPANLPVKRYRIENSPRGRIGVEFAGMARTPNGQGYWEVTTQGHVYAYGNAQHHGSPAPAPSPVVGIAATASGNGYWISTAAGHIYAYGDALHRGAAIDYAPLFPIVGIAAEAGGNGYWQVASDGGVFAFEAPFQGSMGGRPLNAPVVGMASTTDGQGYWLVGADGGIFNFNAPLHGSMGGRPLNQPIVGVAGAPNNGYWLLGKDGGIFAFPEGSQPFAGSTQGRLADMPNGTPAHAVAIASTPGSVGYGYWIQFRDGGILDLGPAGFHGDVSFG